MEGQKEIAHTFPEVVLTIHERLGYKLQCLSQH